MKKFIATLALLIVTGFAVSAHQSSNRFTSPSLIPGKPCVPSPDYFKTTVRVEIKGTLTHIPAYELERDPKNLILFPEIAQISANGKTYHLNLSGAKELSLQARKLSGQIVIVTGTLHESTVQVMDLRLPMLKDAREQVHETTEVEARGRLRTIRVPNINTLDIYIEAPIVAVELVVDGKTYNLELTSELCKLAVSLEGKDVVLSGVLNNDTINVNSLTVAK